MSKSPEFKWHKYKIKSISLHLSYTVNLTPQKQPPLVFSREEFLNEHFCSIIFKD